MTTTTSFTIDASQRLQLNQSPLAASFAKAYHGDWNAWTTLVRGKLRDLLGHAPQAVPLDPVWENEEDCGTFIQRRFSIATEPGARIPGYILTPKRMSGKTPTVICLQGHAPGMHITIGRPRNDRERELIAGGRDFALQVVREGYVATVIEQRCLGERKCERAEFKCSPEDRSPACHHAAMTALILGRTVIGERAWDVSRTVDFLETLPYVDGKKIGCMGNSGGGTATYYATACEPRIALAMPSCSVCSYRASIAAMDHCTCNFIPGILDWFEMGDLAGLIAPRPLIVVAGDQDPIFPFDASKETFSTIQEIYRATKAEDRCSFVVGRGGHRFYPEQAWPVFAKMLTSL